MDTKKPFASLLEDHSPGPSTSALRPPSPSPFRDGCPPGETRSGLGGEGSSHSRSQSAALDLDLAAPDQVGLSCVTKETSQEDCARHRFIVWAAVKRNSSVRMTSQERLECPLLRCTQRFADHEGMLKHLAGCRYLASGEYWCYDHMRVERFDDLKCKRCLGHPSKRRKILGMAKNFFHSLGHHKSKKAQGPDAFDHDDDVMMPPPPSYDSLNIRAVDSNATELPSTEIVEIDSMELPLLQPTPLTVPMPMPMPMSLPSPMPAPTDVINPQALLMPALPELDSTMLSSEAYISWQPMPGIPQPFPMMAEDDGSMRAPGARPILQLSTAGLQGRRQAPRPVARPAPVIPRSKGLSPSSSVRSTASTDTNASTVSNGSSIISPASNWSGAWSMASGLNTSLTSPVDGVVADDMFADALNDCSNDFCPDSLHDFFSELPADFPILNDACDMATDPLLGYDTSLPVNLTYAPEITLTDEAAQTVEIPLAEAEVEQTNTCCSETKSLVSAAWDALQEHIVSSMVKIRDQKDNSLVNQLSSMSIQTVATTGLRTLRALINGQQPSSAGDALCLIHLVYAFSLVLHEQEAPDHFGSLFLQSLGYVNGLPSNDRELYRQLVMSIWQPPDLSQADVSNHFAILSGTTIGLSPDPKGKAPQTFNGQFGQGGDSLLAAARDFLDELEISLMSQGSLPLDVQVSDLHITHLKDTAPTGAVNGALVATARYVLEVLSQVFGDAQLNSRLREVYHGISGGSIPSVRKIEIEILQAGRSCMSTANFFGSFVPNTRRLCDQMYEKHDVGAARRDVYHSLGVSLIESLIPEFDSAGGRAAEPPLDDIDAFFNDLNSELGNADTALMDLQPPGQQTFGFTPGQTHLPTPTATATSSSGNTPTATPPADQPPQNQPQPQPISTPSPHPQAQPAPKTEANACCEICGYRPKGDPQWFRGSMAKHKKLQHSSAPPRIYKCPFPGCTSQYKNRPDNLRQHQIEKNHWVEGNGGETARRPSKRKKVEVEGEGE
ncbi:hypothetical protein C8A05DRAFT_37958 [Staphylotrichum tortipilum]|uniref:Uncharacterized protein n=1 Tax=Staphylotrichum tortipilum TaxID=2831512 RepID=A0AAN6MEF9_9PEZI|nr:hypothetical protein C8A05DRAFT_37958 [Staphylotrichum longicolle]